MSTITSNKTDPDTLSQFPLTFGICATVVTILLMLMTVIGNSLVIVVFTRFSILQKVTNYFIVSLACTDLCVGLISMPLCVAFLINGSPWVLGKTLSRIWNTIDLMISTASIMNLTAISLDRYMCITKPLRYFTIVTPRRIFIAIGSIWLYAIGLSVASLLSYEYRIFNFVVATLCFFVPLLIIVTTYTIVFRVALRHVRQITAFQTPVQYSEHWGQVKVRSCIFWKELKATRTLAIVVGAFVICWTPFVIINIKYSLCTSSVCPTIKPDVIMFTKWMHYGNSMLNPIIYVMMNQGFRKFFVKFVFGHFRAATLRIPRNRINNDVV